MLFLYWDSKPLAASPLEPSKHYGFLSKSVPFCASFVKGEAGLLYVARPKRRNQRQSISQYLSWLGKIRVEPSKDFSSARNFGICAQSCFFPMLSASRKRKGKNSPIQRCDHDGFPQIYYKASFGYYL
jgi:hypothetical protein